MVHLQGHSGCQIILLDDKTVRKTSASLQYNNRLKMQMEKQISFNHEILQKPKILDSGVDNTGKFYFDMEYINGVNLCKFFEKESLNKCMSVIDIFLSFRNKTSIDITDKLLNKINSMDILEEDRSVILNTNWIVDSGYCHGDLTFENIIVSKNGIYLIDFLDSFADSPIIDESKLLQDAFCYWSFKNQNYIPKRKLISVCEIFDTKKHYTMLLLHLYRILPYATNDTKELVLCMMNRVKKKINQY